MFFISYSGSVLVELFVDLLDVDSTLESRFFPQCQFHRCSSHHPSHLFCDDCFFLVSNYSNISHKKQPMCSRDCIRQSVVMAVVLMFLTVILLRSSFSSTLQNKVVDQVSDIPLEQRRPIDPVNQNQCFIISFTLISINTSESRDTLSWIWNWF